MMTPAEREAAEALYAALASTQCHCVVGKRVLPIDCARCAAMWKWERVVLEEAG